MDIRDRLLVFLTGDQALLQRVDEYFMQRLDELIDYTFLDEDGMAVLEAVRDGKIPVDFGPTRSTMSKLLLAHLDSDDDFHIANMHVGYLLARLEELVDYTSLDEEGLAVLEAVRDGQLFPLVKVLEVA